MAESAAERGGERTGRSRAARRGLTRCALAMRLDEEAKRLDRRAELHLRVLDGPPGGDCHLLGDPHVPLGRRLLGVGVDNVVVLVGASADGLAGRTRRRAELILPVAVEGGWRRECVSTLTNRGWRA